MRMPSNWLLCLAMSLTLQATTFAQNATTIIPQVAVGSFDGGVSSITSFVHIVNQTSTDAMVTAEFFGQDGSVSIVPFDTTDPAVPSFTGALGPVTLPANSSLVITSSPSATPALNWGRITTDSALVVTSTFEIRDTGGNLISRVGVPGSAATLSNAVIPRIRDIGRGIGTGFSVVNAGTTDATVTATLYADATMVAQTEFPLAAGNHTSKFIHELLAPLPDPAGLSYSHLVLESTNSSLAAIAIALEGSDLATFPVSRLDGSPAPSGTTVASPVGTYTGTLLVGFYNCSDSEFGGNIFFGDFVVTDNNGGIAGEAVFVGNGSDEVEDDGPITLNFHFEAGISGTGELTSGTYTETVLVDGPEGTGAGEGTVVGNIDGSTMTLTLIGSHTDTAPPNVSCDIVVSFSQP